MFDGDFNRTEIENSGVTIIIGDPTPTPTPEPSPSMFRWMLNWFW